MKEKELTLNDDENLGDKQSCEHNLVVQGDVKVNGIIWDIYYCSKCLLHVKKERPCPLHLEEIK